MELFLTNDLNSYFLTLLTRYIGLEQSNRIKLITLSPQAQSLIQEGIIKLPSLPCLITEETQILTNVFPIAQYLCQISYSENILIGQENTMLGEILQVFEAQRKLDAQQLIDMYTSILENKTFLVSTHITIADLFLFSHSYDIVSKFDDDDKRGKYIHFFRWFKHIQSLPSMKSINDALGRQQIQLPSPFVKSTQNQKKKQKK